MASEVANPQLASVRSSRDIRRVTSLDTDRGTHYYETQIFGGVSVDDIDAIYFSTNELERIGESTLSTLRQFRNQGISIYHTDGEVIIEWLG